MQNDWIHIDQLIFKSRIFIFNQLSIIKNFFFRLSQIFFYFFSSTNLFFFFAFSSQSAFFTRWRSFPQYFFTMNFSSKQQFQLKNIAFFTNSKAMTSKQRRQKIIVTFQNYFDVEIKDYRLWKIIQNDFKNWKIEK